MTYDTIPGPPILPESHLYTFIDEAREFALHFLEGQRLIQDLALVHPIRGPGFAYFRDVVLSIQPMIAFLKRGEQLGFYIDSTAPFFRLKIETGHHGEMRCTLLPEEFQEFPDSMHGMVRLQKLFPNNRPPYDSVLEIRALPLRAIVNRVLTESYQVNSAVIVSGRSDQSVMLHQLPPIPRRGEYEYSYDAVRSRRGEIGEDVQRIFDRALHRPGEVQAAFAELGFRLLAGRDVRFRCACSRERMVQNILLVTPDGHEHLFDPGQQALEIICEYCKSRYSVTREDLQLAARPLH